MIPFIDWPHVESDRRAWREWAMESDSMAKKPEAEESGPVDQPGEITTLAEATAAPVPFAVLPPVNSPPTEAQLTWMKANPAYVRISHALLGRFTLRGTLTPDGAFVSDTKSPVIDGGGCFGVGIPVPR